jgi:autotransporter-associated beta strand protein
MAVFLFFRAAALALALLASHSLHAVNYYWDNNGSTDGFGTAGGTWAAPTTNNSTQGWSTAVTGNATLSGTTTTSSISAGDVTYFGTTDYGLGGGTITVGNVGNNGIVFGSTNGAVILNGGTITIRGNIVTSADNTTGDMQTINSNVTFVLNAARTIGGGGGIADKLTINGNIGATSVSNNLAISTENNLGTVTLNGTNTFTSNLVVQTGQLNVSRVNNIGVAGTLGNGTTLVFGNGVASTPNLWYTGTSANSTNRTINLNGGTTRIISQDAKLTLAGNISPTGATPVLQLSGDGGGNFNEVSGVISGNIAVQVVSHQPVGGTAEAGAWILSGNNTYTGATTISAGTLAVSGNIASSGLVINSGGIISPGTSGAVDTFGTSSITINGGGYNWTLSSANGSAGTAYDQITSTGALTSSGLLTVYAYGTPGDWDNAANYSWDIFSANSVSGFSAGNFALDFTNFGIAAGNRTGTFSFSNPSGGIIRLTYTASSGPVWTGGAGNWSTGFTTAPTDGATIAFSGAGGTATNNISTGTLTTVGDIEFRSGAGAYTLASDTGSAGASGGTALTVNGSIINDSTATQTLNTDLAFAATRTIAANTGNITIGGAISGAGGLTKNGSNKLTLTAANTYTGDTTINTGTLQIGEGSTTGSLSASTAITNDANLVFNRLNDLTVSNTIGGTGNLTKSGAGTLTLSGNNTYSGATTVTAGTLEIGAGGRLGGGSYAGAITNNANFIYSGTNNQTLTGVISGTGALTQNAASTLTLSNAATAYSGPTTISAGTLSLNFASTTAAFASSTTVNAGATLRYAPTANSLITSSAAAVDLQGALVYNPSGNFYHVMNASVTANAPSTIQLSAGGITSAGLFLDGGLKGSANVTVTSNTNGVGLVLRTANSTYSGTLTVNGNASTTSGTGSGLMIGNYGSAPALSNANLTINGTLELGNALTGMGWSGQSVNGTTVSINALNGTGVVVGNMKTAASTRTLSVGNNNGSGDFSGVIANGSNNTLGFTKNGSGTQTLSGANTYTGTTTINAGTLQIGNGTTGSLSTSSAVVNNANLLYGTTTTTGTYGLSSSTTGTGSLAATAKLIRLNGNITQSGNVTLASSTNGTAAYTDGIELVSDTTITAGNITISGDLGRITAHGGNLTLDTSATNGAITLNVSISRNGDWFGFNSFTANAGTGNLTVSGANAGSGNWRGPSGANLTGALNISSSFTVEVASGTPALNLTATGNSSVTGNLGLSGTTNTWTVNPGLTMTVSGNISGTSAAITKNGTGTLTLSGNNTYTGLTTINAGTLVIGHANGLGTTGNITFSGGSLQYGSSITTDLSSRIKNSGSAMLVDTNGESVTWGTAIGSTNSGGLTKNGTGTLTLTGSNSYSGGTTLNAGTLVIGNTAAAGTGTITQSSGSSLLKFDTTGTVSNNMSIYNVASNQTMTLSGSITAQNTTYDVASGTTLSINGTISGSGGVTKNGTGTLTLTGNNTFTGNTTINSGTLRAGAANALGDTGEVMVNSGGSLLIAASEAIDNAAAVKLNGGTIEFDGNVTETLGAFTLLANSTIDMAGGNIWLQFSGLSPQMAFDLKIYNYTLYSDYLYFVNTTNVSESLSHIKFYSDSGSSLIGSSFIENSFGPSPYHVRPVPEPETYATAALLLLGLGIYAYRRRQVRTTT